MRTVLVCVFIVFCNSILPAQDQQAVFNDLVDYLEAKEEYTERNNGQGTRSFAGEQVKVKEFDKEHWKKVIGSTDYNENTPVMQQEKPDSDLERNAEGERRRRGTDTEKESTQINLPSAPWSSGSLRVISYLVIIAVVLLILFYVFKNASSKEVQSKNIDPDDHTAIENIEDLDVDGLLQKALSEGNFRLAIRLYYLGLLKSLNQKGFIVWEKDKTNREYLSELISRDNLYEDVQKLTLAYEKAWYGEHILEYDSAQTIIGSFEVVNQKLNTATIN